MMLMRLFFTEVRSNSVVTSEPKPGTGVVGWSCGLELPGCHEGLFYSSQYFDFWILQLQNKKRTPLGELRKKSCSLVTWGENWNDSRTAVFSQLLKSDSILVLYLLESLCVVKIRL